MQKVHKKEKFTLIELLVVVSLIGILASLLMPSLSNARAKAQKAVCMSNLKQAGIAIMIYSGDGDGIIATNLMVNTATNRNMWEDNNVYKGQFHGGEQGYLEPYLGNDEEAYMCPGSEHEEDFGDWPLFTSVKGHYMGFTDWRYTLRKIEKNTISNPIQDSLYNWNEQNMTPLLMDPVMDTSIWGGTWVNSNSIIHGNKGTIPILILDGRVHQFNRTKYPAIWPTFPWEYQYIVDDLLNQIN